MKKITAVIPAYNEEKRIEPVLKKTKNFVDEIIVVDDASTDKTVKLAEKYGKVLRNKKNMGYIACIKKGFKNAKHEIIVTIDADGEHNPEDIPRLTELVIQNQGDLVLGVRSYIPRFSERFINRITNFKVKTKDCGTGFKAISKKLAVKLKLKGRCICGVFVLEAAYNNARIVDIPIKTKKITKKRKIAWVHFIQLFYVLRWLFRKY